MKKLLILIILPLAILTGLFLFEKKPDSFTIQNQKISLTNTDTTYSIEINYPKIISGAKTKIIDSINNQLFNHISYITTQTEKEYQEYIKELGSLPEYASLSFVSEYRTYFDFNHSPFVSFIFENYSYTGGAHGIVTIDTFVFDIKTGKQLQFADVFLDFALQEISKLSLLELKKIDPTLETYTFAEEGTAPLPENFSHWVIGEAGIKFIFGDYQVGPYTSGRPEVLLDWSHLLPFLKPEFKAPIKFFN